MNIDTGNIISPLLAQLLRERAEAEPSGGDAAREASRFQRMELSPSAEQVRSGRVRPYDFCPCNSGKKFKFCCKAKD
jgi:uncharacterized protein YecA (UPF0149 family)